jgi:3-methyl-2-oxobutanoate hydroxymethyltransferase
MSTRPRTAGKLQLPELADMKRRGDKIVMVTAYDAPGARLADGAGIDLILVGDTAAMVVLGHDSTVPVTMDEMIFLTRSVARAAQRPLVIGDMPFGTYEASDDDAVHNAIRFVKEGGADVVKLEGAGPSLSRVHAIAGAGIGVMGHIGLTPQTATALGGHKAQGRQADAARRLFLDAISLERSGCFALVLEAVPAPVATTISRRLAIPTIGIGSGPGTDGQVLVLHDMLGIPGYGREPRFVKRYAEIGELMGAAVAAYATEVRNHVYPAEEHTYTIPPEELEAFQNAVDAGSIEENTLADW